MKRFRFCILFLFFCTFLYPEEKLSELLKKATKLEKQGQMNETLPIYKQALELSKEVHTSEWITLKLARLSTNVEQKIAFYNQFISNFPDSQFIKLAYYEIAAVHFLLKDYAKALDSYRNLLEISYGTSYFAVSGLYCAALYLNLKEPDKAIEVLHILLEEISTDEELSKSYFLIGKAYLMKNQPENAVQNFSICTGTFPKTFYAKKAAEELGKMNQSGKELKMVSIDKNDNDNLLNAIEADIKSSINLNKENNTLPEGFYLQLGSYSEEKNALLQIEQIKAEKIGELHIYPKKTSSGFFYKVIMGPFSDKDKMNDALITLKDCNIDAFLIELPEED